jgi:hypothetical protein
MQLSVGGYLVRTPIAALILIVRLTRVFQTADSLPV